MNLEVGKKYNLSWQGDSEVVYELISINLGYAQLRNIKINTLKWANIDHLIEYKEVGSWLYQQ